jgi:MFS family permease
VITYGFALGAPLILNPLLTSDYLGMKNFGSLFGILSIMGTIGGAAGPIISGFYFDKNGTYLPVFYGFGILMVVGVLCTIAIKPLSREPLT